eukprot:GHVN01053830.1.p1 GENE.GHVN01053830.1~~GHVN01053830.1.p1  ORF type:complete len:985 (+),score=170.82 GHVN01053830.1:133-3087(+)
MRLLFAVSLWLLLHDALIAAAVGGQVKSRGKQIMKEHSAISPHGNNNAESPSLLQQREGPSVAPTVQSPSVSSEADDELDEEEKADVCMVPNMIMTSLKESARYPHFHKISDLLVSQGQCDPAASNHKVCKESPEYHSCCSDQMGLDLINFFAVKNCLFGAVMKGAVLQDLAGDHGKLAEAVKRLRDAVETADGGLPALYSEQADMLESMRSDVEAYMTALADSDIKAGLEKIRYYISDILCSVCSPAFTEQSNTAGDTVILKLDSDYFREIQESVVDGLRGSFSSLGQIMKKYLDEDGWLAQASKVKNKHFIELLAHVSKEISEETDEHLDKVLKNVEKPSTASDYIKDRKPKAKVAHSAADDAPVLMQMKVDSDGTVQPPALTQPNAQLAPTPTLRGAASSEVQVGASPAVAVGVINGDVLSQPQVVNTAHDGQQPSALQASVSETTPAPATGAAPTQAGEPAAAVGEVPNLADLVAANPTQPPPPTTGDQAAQPPPPNTGDQLAQPQQPIQAAQPPPSPALMSQPPAGQAPSEAGYQPPPPAGAAPGGAADAPPAAALPTGADAVAPAGVAPAVADTAGAPPAGAAPAGAAGAAPTGAAGAAPTGAAGAAPTDAAGAAPAGAAGAAPTSAAGAAPTSAAGAAPAGAAGAAPAGAAVTTPPVSASANPPPVVPGVVPGDVVDPQIAKAVGADQASQAAAANITAAMEHHVVPKNGTYEAQHSFTSCIRTMKFFNNETMELDDKALRKAVENSMEELAGRTLFVALGLGPQLCLYDLVVNTYALLPDPRVDAEVRNKTISGETGEWQPAADVSQSYSDVQKFVQKMMKDIDELMQTQKASQLVKDDVLLVSETGQIMKQRMMTESQKAAQQLGPALAVGGAPEGAAISPMAPASAMQTASKFAPARSAHARRKGKSSHHQLATDSQKFEDNVASFLSGGDTTPDSTTIVVMPTADGPRPAEDISEHTAIFDGLLGGVRVSLLS